VLVGTRRGDGYPTKTQVLNMAIEYIEIDVETIRETDMAVLFFDGAKEFWVPQSVMDDWPNEGESGIAMVAEWFAIKEGLI